MKCNIAECYEAIELLESELAEIEESIRAIKTIEENMVLKVVK